MKKNLRNRYPSLLVLALFCGTASADDYHYNNMLVGDRASGLGGAYTAVSDDATGAYYNPAGIAYTRGRNIAAAANAYHMTSASYKNVLGGGDWTRRSSSLLPNFFGVTQPLGKGVAGFSYVVTDSIQENLDRQFQLSDPVVNDYRINLNNNDSTYKLGPSYAMEVRDGLSVGITLYGHIRSAETMINQVVTGVTTGTPPASDHYEWSSLYSESYEVGVDPVIGIMWSPLERFSLGASLRKTTLVHSSHSSQATCVTSIPSTTGGDVCHDTSGNPNKTPNTVSGDFSNDRAYPLTLTLGTAWFPTDRLLYSADFTYYDKADGTAGNGEDTPFRTKSATWNASAGMEYYLSNVWALRGGVFTNNANTPNVADGINQPEHVDILGLSATISRFTRNYSLTTGFAYSEGEGEAQIVAGLPGSQKEHVVATTFFLSTSYTY